jgi:Spy/CpxP family protein refolding chaperone
MKKLPIIALALGAGALVLTAFSGGGCGHHRPADPEAVAARVTEHVDDALDDLDATPEQRTRIRAIVERTLAAGRPLHEDGKAAHAEALAQWKATTPDAAKLHALVDERVEALRAFAHQAVDGAVEAHDVLTAEQRAKITTKLERHARH